MPEEDESFDPYRFGHPDVPPPPEFAPPGYKPPPVDLSKPSTPPSGPPQHTPQQPPQQAPYGQNPYPSSYPPPPQQQPPHQWGAPYPPYQPAPLLGRGTSGKAIAGMVLGIAALTLFWTTIIDLVVIVLAVIFSILGMNEAKAKRIRGRGQAIAGLVCAGVAAVLVVVSIVLFLHAADQCGGVSNQNAPGFNKCVEDHLF